MTDYNHQSDWFYEGNVSKKLVIYLEKNGYEILKDNSDNIRAKGEDIIARREGHNEIIEVKGYPTVFYTNGVNKGLPKKTNPKLQAKHWFSEALLSIIFNYQKHRIDGDFSLVLAFPLMDRYKELIKKVGDFFTDNNLDIKVYFVNENGSITIDNLNRKQKKTAGNKV